MAAKNTARSKVAALGCTMQFECVERIARTGRLEAARAAKPWTQKVAIGTDRQRQHAARRHLRSGEACHAALKLPNTRLSSSLAASRKVTDAALGNRSKAKGARKRTTH